MKLNKFTGLGIVISLLAIGGVGAVWLLSDIQMDITATVTGGVTADSIICTDSFTVDKLDYSSMVWLECLGTIDEAGDFSFILTDGIASTDPGCTYEIGLDTSWQMNINLAGGESIDTTTPVIKSLPAGALTMNLAGIRDVNACPATGTVTLTGTRV